MQQLPDHSKYIFCTTNKKQKNMLIQLVDSRLVKHESGTSQNFKIQNEFFC